MNTKEVVGLRKIFLLLVISFLITFPAMCNAGLQDFPKIAVLEFGNKTSINDETLNDGKYVRELAINELLNAGRFNVMEFDAEYRKAYAQIHNIDVRDTKDFQSNLKLAKLLGIEYLVVGNVTGFISVGSDAYMSLYDSQHNKRRPNNFKATLTIRFYETESGRIALAAQGIGKAEEKRIDGKISAVQVHEALTNAVHDAINGKFGLLAKMEKGKKNN